MGAVLVEAASSDRESVVAGNRRGSVGIGLAVIRLIVTGRTVGLTDEDCRENARKKKDAHEQLCSLHVAVSRLDLSSLISELPNVSG